MTCIPSLLNRTLLLFMLCESRGAKEYSRSLLVFRCLLHYWFKKGLPVKELFMTNHTLFSEESGEVALSVLSHSQPPSHVSDLKQTQKYWLMTKHRYSALHGGDFKLPRFKKHRVVGSSSLFPPFMYSCQCMMWAVQEIPMCHDRFLFGLIKKINLFIYSDLRKVTKGDWPYFI